MRLFISHANADLALAQTLRVRLQEISDELSCFVLADDVFGGDLWEERIRAVACDCDGILSLVTTRYVERPWFVAEWALFWFQDKPWYLLVDDVDLDKVFEPMRRRQASRLEDRYDIERFLRALPVKQSGSRSLDVVASELTRAFADACATAARARLEANLVQFAVSLKKGTQDVSDRVVDELIRAGGLPNAVGHALGSDNSVALRQFAVILVERGAIDQAQTVSDQIPNNAERRSVGLAVLDRLAEEPARTDLDVFVRHIFVSVREPQRRDMKQGASRRGISIDWPDVAPNP